VTQILKLYELERSEKETYTGRLISDTIGIFGNISSQGLIK